jgi:hypothetical protein
MKAICILVALAVGTVFAASAAAQDDTTTTTTSTTVTPPQHGAFIGVPGVAGVEVGGRPGCVTRSKTETDQDTGQTRSVSESNCP